MKIKTFIIIIHITILSLFLSGQTTASNGATTQRADLAGANIEQRQDLPLAIAAQSTTINATKTNDIEGLRSSPVMFIENVGQFDDGARFQVRGGDGTIWLTEDALWITALERSAVSGQPSVNQDHLGALSTRNLQSEIQNRKGVNIKLSFPGSNPHPRLEPFNRLETHVSYFIGNDPAKWRADVPVWGGVRYKDLYPGIDLEITSEKGHLVQRLVARENVDLEAVQLRVDGADRIELLPSPSGKGAGGEVLRLTTAAGEYTLPLLQVNGAGSAKPPRPTITGSQIAAPFTQSPLSTLQSSISSSSDLLYATFLGGNDSDVGYDIAIDSSGAAYVTGLTGSSDFPTTPGAFDTSYNGGGWDVFVVKLNASGSALTYATFLGGSYYDWVFRIALDSSGAVYVTGTTESSDFPTTPGAFDTSYNGNDDAFVVKLNATGTALSYATFLGGSGGEEGTGIAIDASGAAVVTGRTGSSDFPTTPGAFDTSYNGNDDAFVVKLNASGSALTYATFLGGSYYDWVFRIALDSSGAAYVTGSTYSSDFPTTPGAFDTSYNGGEADAFVVKLGMGGGTTTYSISGRFMDGNGNPIQGVTISAGAVGSVVTNASGYYTISGLPQGEYMLRPSKTGFRFEPETLNVTLSGNRTGQNFRGYNTACAAPLAEPFLRFPVDYGGRDFSLITKDTDEGGLINSWFDHLSPLYTANYSITLFTGKTYSKTRTSGPYFGNLYCYDHRCYDGHNGIDIVAPDKEHNPNPPVLAAAAGTVVRVDNSTTGYGKQVWIDHGNNYATLYGHLDRIDVSVGQHVTAGQQLGLMGSTGNSTGTHLHFGVYFNYNLRDPWITTTGGARPDEVVDPFGWEKKEQNDPWGTPSVRLWQESAGENRYTGQSGGSLSTPNVTAVIPAGSVYTDTLFSLNEAPVAGASAQLRHTGLSFFLRILSVLGGSGGQSLSIAAAETLSAPVTITVSYAGASLRHLDPAHLAPYYYEEATGSWTEIAATVNSSDKTVTFQTDRTGDFSLQAPLLCPAESQEPDDHYMLAETLAVPGTASRLIDIADDEDWFTFDATAGQRYVLSTGSLVNGVKPVVRLYDTDGVTLLASAEVWRSTLQWQAPADGKYFVRVTPAGDSTYGCEAAYTLNLSRLMQVYLPLVLRNR